MARDLIETDLVETDLIGTDLIETDSRKRDPTESHPVVTPIEGMRLEATAVERSIIPSYTVVLRSPQ